MDPYADFTTATMVFLFCTFGLYTVYLSEKRFYLNKSFLGLLGIILAMSLLLYRVNLRARHQRQIQDHINTIHAILGLILVYSLLFEQICMFIDMSGTGSGEATSTVDEEIIIPDEPPDYEPPPEYSDVFKYVRGSLGEDQSRFSLILVVFCLIKLKLSETRSGSVKSKTGTESASSSSQPLKLVSSQSSRSASVCRSCQTSPVKVPSSVYHDDESTFKSQNYSTEGDKVPNH